MCWEANNLLTKFPHFYGIHGIIEFLEGLGTNSYSISINKIKNIVSYLAGINEILYSIRAWVFRVLSIPLDLL